MEDSRCVPGFGFREDLLGLQRRFKPGTRNSGPHEPVLSRNAMLHFHTIPKS
jgi:hypothetical protein